MAQTDARASAAQPVIAIEGLTKSFGANQVLKGVDLRVGKGEVVAIIGPSGSGKSTFLRCLNLLEEVTSGRVVVEGADLTRHRLGDFLAGMARATCPQT